MNPQAHATATAMPAHSLYEQLTKYLTDAHSIEQQALAQMRSAPRIAADGEIAAAFAQHLGETEQHEQLVHERLRARGAAPAPLKDIAGTLTGKGFVIFARLQPDTPGKLVAHAYSYEHMELGAYELLAAVADRAGDADTAGAARSIAAQEQAMGERLAALFDRAAEASLHAREGSGIEEQLNRYLADAHAIEVQALKLLGRSPRIAGAPELARAYAEHREETETHERLIAERLRARGAGVSRVKDAALALGALNWGAFFMAQPDTPAKLAAFAFAFEHLEIAGYELLLRVAARAGDAETEQVAGRILGEERAAAQRIRSLFELALDASLHEQGLAA